MGGGWGEGGTGELGGPGHRMLWGDAGDSESQACILLPWQCPPPTHTHLCWAWEVRALPWLPCPPQGQ